jgi:hypothetical protein
MRLKINKKRNKMKNFNSFYKIVVYMEKNVLNLLIKILKKYAYFIYRIIANMVISVKIPIVR